MGVVIATVRRDIVDGDGAPEVVVACRPWSVAVTAT